MDVSQNFFFFSMYYIAKFGNKCKNLFLASLTLTNPTKVPTEYERKSRGPW
jgi:hypothetical protein